MSDRPFDEKTTARPIVRLFQSIDILYARIYQHLEIISPSRIPPTGPAILVCNHTSGLDPFMIQCACKRVIIWMMAREYYEIRALNWAFKQIEAIPVARNGQDLAATRQAMRALHNGRVLGIFPEGSWERTHELLPFQTGVAMLAIKTKTKVYPAYLDGSQRNKEIIPAFLGRHNVSLRFAPAIDLAARSTSRESLESGTQQIHAAIESMRQQSLRESPWRAR